MNNIDISFLKLEYPQPYSMNWKDLNFRKKLSPNSNQTKYQNLKKFEKQKGYKMSIELDFNNPPLLDIQFTPTSQH